MNSAIITATLHQKPDNFLPIKLSDVDRKVSSNPRMLSTNMKQKSITVNYSKQEQEVCLYNIRIYNTRKARAISQLNIPE